MPLELGLTRVTRNALSDTEVISRRPAIAGGFAEDRSPLAGS